MIRSLVIGICPKTSIPANRSEDVLDSVASGDTATAALCLQLDDCVEKVGIGRDSCPRRFSHRAGSLGRGFHRIAPLLVRDSGAGRTGTTLLYTLASEGFGLRLRGGTRPERRSGREVVVCGSRGSV